MSAKVEDRDKVAALRCSAPNAVRPKDDAFLAANFADLSEPLIDGIAQAIADAREEGRRERREPTRELRLSITGLLVGAIVDGTVGISGGPQMGGPIRLLSVGGKVVDELCELVAKGVGR